MDDSGPAPHRPMVVAKARGVAYEQAHQSADTVEVLPVTRDGRPVTATGYRTNRHGELTLTDDVRVAAPPSARSQGVIDLAVTEDEKFLYVQNATSGTVDGFRIGRNGSLTKTGTTDRLPPFAESGMEGIAAV
ncbi:hypothetical protein ACFV23_47560 [Streptomyces sp. NPDC059627]